MAEDNPVPVPHALFQKLIIILRAILPFRVLQDQSGIWQYLYDHSFTACAILITLASYLVTVLILKNRFYQNWQKMYGKKVYFYAWLAAIGLLLLNPILLFTLKDRLILGYIPANVWHNPTYVLMRPFALWLFFFILDYWDKKLNVKQSLLIAFISYLLVFAKPNFTLSIIPALAIFYSLKKRLFKSWNWSLIAPLLIPSLLGLFYEYWFMTLYPTESRFFFAPLVSALYYAGNIHFLMLLLFLSITFPVLLTLLDWKSIIKDSGFQLACLNFAIALLTFLLFTELPHIAMLNFSWGAVMAVFILFVVCINHLILNYSELKKHFWKKSLLLGSLSLHLVSGIVYTILSIVQAGPVR
ncbi:MAG: hypothetical protein VB108_02335 [Anaerolineaceae bacterium]|nr:hypothetical protein [Anaerolineaceae bacterium]